MCVIGKKGRKSTNKLCKNYKLDKTELVMGTLVIDGTRGENDWYVSGVKLSVNDVPGVTSTLNINEITNDTNGTEVVMTSSTKNGKTATKKYTIKVDKTAPIVGTLNINGTKGTADWYLSDVILTVNNGSDETSGHASTTSSHTKITTNTKGTNVVVTTKHKAGNVATREYTIKVNKDKPIEGTLVIDGTRGENDWYVSDVKFSVKDGSDNMSGHASTTSSIASITKDTIGTKVILTTKDKAGNVVTKEQTIKMDKTAPTIEMVNPTNGNWTNQNIEITTNFSDITSGIVPSSLAWSDDNTNWHNYSNTSTTTFKDTWSGEGNRTGYNRVCDNAGNCNTTSTPIRIDKVAPTISFDISGSLGEIAVINCSDSLSGMSVNQSTKSLSMGADRTISGSCTDRAGNTTTSSHTYKYNYCKVGSNTCQGGYVQTNCSSCYYGSPSECQGGYVRGSCSRYKQARCGSSSCIGACYGDGVRDNYYCATNICASYSQVWDNCATTKNTCSYGCDSEYDSCKTGSNTCQGGFNLN